MSFSIFMSDFQWAKIECLRGEKNLMPWPSNVHGLTSQKAGLEMCGFVIYVLYTF